MLDCGHLRRAELLLYRLHYATDGVVGNLMNLMLNTAIMAAEQGKDSLDLVLLSLAFQKRLAKHLRGKVDPFAEVVRDRFAPEPLDRANAVGNRAQRRKKRKPSVAAVLTTR